MNDKAFVDHVLKNAAKLAIFILCMTALIHCTRLAYASMQAQEMQMQTIELPDIHIGAKP